MEKIVLRYHYKSREIGEANFGPGVDMRQWDLISPILPEYGEGLGRRPTMSLEQLQALGLVPVKKAL